MDNNLLQRSLILKIYDTTVHWALLPPESQARSVSASTVVNINIWPLKLCPFRSKQDPRLLLQLQPKLKYASESKLDGALFWLLHSLVLKKVWASLKMVMVGEQA